MEEQTLEMRLGDTLAPSETPATVESPVLCPSSINEKVLIRRIDIRVIPMLVIIALSSFLDRVNISNALTMSLPKDLGLKGVETNVALTIFFIPYILFEIPSNLFLYALCSLESSHLPRVLVGPLIGPIDGMLKIKTVTTYRGLLVTRFFLGLAEAGVYPGSFYLISTWYKREESQKRFTAFYGSVFIANICGGLLASGIAKMDGIRGLHNWRWIFILEGAFTLLVGILSLFLVAEFPENATWLSDEERKFVIARAKCTGQTDNITPRDIVVFFKDPNNILAGIMYLCRSPFAYFTPTIVKTLGYSVIQTQLHSVPPIAAAFVLCTLLAYLSDKVRLRFPFIAFGIILGISGLSIMMTIRHNFSVQYAGLCLAAMGLFSCSPLIICWYVMNFQSHTERAIGTAWLNAFGNCGGFVATFAFLQTDAPYYHIGYTICMVAVCLCGGAASLYALLLRRKNMALRSSTMGEKSTPYYSL
ncbi:hypothetical protein HYALB_00007525 [Hymenoscyphus albidus]|uniref:Major facilitator superfamily (MFS) profile domain-containing protein n=1 Tax=Hymenoscyphus albidus TaxID=595503 RepID=A0A9N9LWW3_9HELO|nr:hypothetical protein HYALB_00007525 [Hymenoscyphus albidus]